MSREIPGLEPNVTLVTPAQMGMKGQISLKIQNRGSTLMLNPPTRLESVTVQIGPQRAGLTKGSEVVNQWIGEVQPRGTKTMSKKKMRSP